ncbi:MAG: cyclodeaminase [Micavibrio sp.]|nr:MAG: cyclodeaminase [Micavibrio sp.]
MTAALLTEEELRAAAGLDIAALEVIERGFAALADGQVIMPPVLRLDVPEKNGEMDVKTAYIRGFPSFALKVSCGFFDNPKKGLPSLGGLMTLLDAETGHVEAVLLDNGYLTDLRTALAGAVAAKYLARKNARVAGVLGTGMQARLQIEALMLVRDIKTVLVWGRNREHAESCARAIAEKTGLKTQTRRNAEDVVRGCDILVTTTPAQEPLVKADWLHEGLHVTAMGSDAEDKNELEPNVLLRADRYVCDSAAQVKLLGELHHALKAGILRDDYPVTEIGKIITGAEPGRENDAEITICDLTGTGVQDTAIAVYAFGKLRSMKKPAAATATK